MLIILTQPWKNNRATIFNPVSEHALIITQWVCYGLSTLYINFWFPAYQVKHYVYWWTLKTQHLDSNFSLCLQKKVNNNFGCMLKSVHL